MASLMSTACTFLIILMAASQSSSAEAATSRLFLVGDHFGWRQPLPNDTAFYIHWAESNRFQVGDSLVFEYRNDSVLTVEKWGYYHCDSTDPIIAFDNGKSIINLDRPGFFYFISATYDHCKNGQRLIVEVMSPHQVSRSPPPSSIAFPPEASIAFPPEAFSPAASSPDDAHSSGVSVSGGLCSVFVALSVTFVCVLVLAL